MSGLRDLRTEGVPPIIIALIIVLGEEYKQKILWRLNDYMNIDIKLVET